VTDIGTTNGRGKVSYNIQENLFAMSDIVVTPPNTEVQHTIERRKHRITVKLDSKIRAGAVKTTNIIVEEKQVLYWSVFFTSISIVQHAENKPYLYSENVIIGSRRIEHQNQLFAALFKSRKSRVRDWVVSQWRKAELQLKHVVGKLLTLFFISLPLFVNIRVH
jgi:hypothetical protein